MLNSICQENNRFRTKGQGYFDYAGQLAGEKKGGGGGENRTRVRKYFHKGYYMFVLCLFIRLTAAHTGKIC